MPTRKQRRRRDKEKRHEYEVVYVDDDGNEVAVEPEERAQRVRNRRDEQKTGGKPARGTVQSPSWARTAKRSLIFAPIMFATVLLISPDSATIGGQILQTLILLALFVPFSYFLDSMLWRAHQRRVAKPSETRSAGKR